MSKEVIDPEWDNVFRKTDEVEEPLVEVLGHIPIFSLLSPRELQRIARAVHVRRYDPGEVVVRRGVAQSGFYMVHSGSVDIVRLGRSGKSEVVGTLYPPELLGEFSLLDDSPRSSSIVAAEDNELIGFFKPDLMDILVTRPQMGCKILLRLAEEMAHILRGDYTKLLDMGFPFVEVEEGGVEMDPTAS